MSKRGEELREVVGATHELAHHHLASRDGSGQGIARAICEHLGITWEMVSELHHTYCGSDHRKGNIYCAVCEASNALATLLEAADIR